MCLAITKPAGKQIKKKYLENGFDGNPHGAGFAFVRSGAVHVEKGFFTFEAFYAAWRRVPQSAPAIVHFRWATSGDRTSDNCHPFTIMNGRAAVIHNGILPYKTTATHSDTRLFCAEILDPLLAHNPADSPHVRFVVEQTIGQHNKIAVLMETGKIIIYNAKAGERAKGCWYSNSGYRTESRRAWFRTIEPAASGRAYGWDDDDQTFYGSWLRQTSPAPATSPARSVAPQRWCFACKQWVQPLDDYCPLCYASLSVRGLPARNLGKVVTP